MYVSQDSIGSSQPLDISAVGACHSDWRELDDDVMLNSLVTVDSCDAAMKESGDIIQSGVSPSNSQRPNCVSCRQRYLQKLEK